MNIDARHKLNADAIDINMGCPAPSVGWEWIAKVKEWLKIPVIANGVIFSIRDAEDCLMIGRAAVAKPWLFAEAAREVYGREIAGPEVSLPLVYWNFIGLLNGLSRPEHRLGRLKQFTHYFAQNYKFGHTLVARVWMRPGKGQLSFLKLGHNLTAFQIANEKSI